MRHLVGLTALMTMPGVPTLFAGSEVGVEGDTMDTCRVPFPWDETRWDHETFRAVRSLVELRRTEPALQTGGLRWIDATADTITFARELPGRVVVVDLRRAAGAPRRLDEASLTDRRIVERHIRHDTDRHDSAGADGDGLIRLPETAGASIIALHTT